MNDWIPIVIVLMVSLIPFPFIWMEYQFRRGRKK
jgi:hypothetical protein